MQRILNRFIPLTLLTIATASLIPPAQAQALPAKIHFAGAGGDFTQRYGGYQVPEKDTAVSAAGGKLTRYDIHIAKMIEIANDRWCTRPNYKGVHYSFSADRGKIFMGNLFISCDQAKQAVKQFGLGKKEATVIYDRDNKEQFMIPTLNISTSKKVKEFQALVDRIKPECSNDGLCPGDQM
jgi:hypothetical protein